MLRTRASIHARTGSRTSRSTCSRRRPRRDRAQDRRRRRARSDPAPQTRHVEESIEAGELVHTVVDDVADAFLDLLDGLYEEIDELEDHVDQLSGPAVRMRLAELRHELLHARRTVSATRAAVRRIADGRVDTGGAVLFPASIETEFLDTYETLVRATEELDVARDLLAGVRDFLQAKITESQNDVAKKLTVIASLVLVPSLIVGFYGQNFGSAFDDAFWSLGVSGRPDPRYDRVPGDPLPLAPLDLT